MAFENPTNHSVFRMALGKKKKKIQNSKTSTKRQQRHDIWQIGLFGEFILTIMWGKFSPNLTLETWNSFPGTFLRSMIC